MKEHHCSCNVCMRVLCRVRDGTGDRFMDGVSLHPKGRTGAETEIFAVKHDTGADIHICSTCIEGIKAI